MFEAKLRLTFFSAEALSLIARFTVGTSWIYEDAEFYCIITACFQICFGR